jgi:hypothetical protein
MGDEARERARGDEWQPLDFPSRAGLVRFADEALEQFPDRVTRQLVYEIDGARFLVIGPALSAKGDNLLGLFPMLTRPLLLPVVLESNEHKDGLPVPQE